MKYLEKGEFRDLKYVKYIKLDGNQLSVIIDNLFESQRNLEFLGNKKNHNIGKTIQTKAERSAHIPNKKKKLAFQEQQQQRIEDGTR